MLKITDKNFRYTPSFNTDLAKKFRKLQREAREAAAAEIKPAGGSLPGSVVSMKAHRNH